MFKITYKNSKQIIECGNEKCKSKNCIIRYDVFDEDEERDIEFFLCLDCGETEEI